METCLTLKASILYQQIKRKGIIHRNYEVSRKDEEIGSASKLFRKLVNVYVMIFMENKNRKQKRNKKKKSLPFLPLFVRLLLKVEICFACKCNYLQT